MISSNFLKRDFHNHDAAYRVAMIYSFKLRKVTPES